MNTETYVRKVLDEWSTEARVPPGLADRALGRRRAGWRTMRAALVVAAAVLLVVAGVTVGIRIGPRPATRPTPVDTSLRTDPNDALPRRLVAAGQVAVAAYYVGHRDMLKFTRTWYLYNTATGGYQKVPWGWVDVAPGLRQAAVLDGPLPTTRLGLVDMKAHRVTRWMTLPAAAGGLAWSPDGRRLVVTTYARDPDSGNPALGGSNARTGFIVVDVKSGEAHFHRLPFEADNPATRQDFAWSRDGKLIWALSVHQPRRIFYDLNGARRSAPAHEDQGFEQAGLSPNGRYFADSGRAPGPETVVKDAKTGTQVATQPVEQLLAWADDTHLIALGCNPKKCSGKGEDRNRLVLVSLDGKTIIPLTGYRKGEWVPLFTHR